jgi:outer membrane protein assembly factor BamB
MLFQQVRVSGAFLIEILKSGATMKTNRWSMTVAAVVLVCAGSVLAQDWPQWRGANRDGKLTGFTAPAAWPKTLTQKWKVEVGAGDATPALVGDKIYVFSRQGNEEVTQCLEAATGKPVWTDKYEAQAVSGAAARHPGPRSSPAVADGKVVVIGVGGVVTCIDAASGKRLWQKDEFPKVVPQFFVGTSPLIVDGVCIAHVGGRGKGAIIAFDLATGNAKWKCEGDGPAYSSPVVATIDGVKQLVTMTEASVEGVALADGKLLWKVPFAAQGMAYNAATPIVDGNTVIYTGQGRGTKAIQVTKQGDVFTTKDMWSSQVATQFNTPVLKDGKLYGLSLSGRNGNLFCLDAKTGQTVWTDTAQYTSFGSVIDAGSVIIALASDSGNLIVLKPGDKYEEVAKIKVADTAAYGHPVISGKNVYVKDQASLMLLTIE